MSEKTDNRKCERCDGDFRCEAEDGHCWCFELKVEPGTRLEIGKLYADCLCPGCLRSYAAETEEHEAKEA